MSYFLAVAAYRCEINGAPVGSVEFKVLCVEAESAKGVESILRAEQPHSYVNGQGEKVSWALAGVPNIQGVIPYAPGQEIIGFIADQEDFSHWSGATA